MALAADVGVGQVGRVGSRGGMSGGLASTEYSTDGGATWATGTQVLVAADPLGHLHDGANLVLYYSTDALGHTETTQTLTVNLDTVRPTTKAPAAASVRRGKVATLKYRVGDVAPCAGTVTVTIKLRNRHNKVVATLHPGVKTADPLTTRRASFRCKLAKGRYKFTVYAVDAAGNPQLRAASRTLTVR